jgi:glycosyltransferase involved in cell wall biosynthesis
VTAVRFCMVTTFYPPYHFGGDALFVRSLARALAAGGHHVEVVHCEDAFRMRRPHLPAAPPSNADDGVVVHRLRSRLGALSPLITQQTGRPGLKKTALRRILDQPFDVIHFHNISLVGGPAVLAMGRAPVKLYTTHEHWLVCPTHVLWKNRARTCDRPQCLRCCLRSGTPPQLWRYTGLVQRSLRHVDALLTPSAFVAAKHREGGITCPITVLPNFTPITAAAGPTPAPASRPCFLYVGRLTPSKGVLDLVAEFTQLPEYDLVVAGDGELVHALHRLAADRPNIHLLGAVAWEDLPALYQRATATVVPSLGPEVFSLVVLESLACATPVIVRDAGGSTEPIETTRGGVVYRDLPEMRQALRRMAGDSNWRDALANNARQGYQRHYTTQAHLRRYFDIIAEVSARRTARSE